MNIVGVKMTDGRLTLVSKYADGLYLSILGIDFRDAGNLGTGLVTTIGALASLTVYPTPVQLNTGSSTYQFGVIGYDAERNVVAITPVWSIVQGTPFSTINSVTGVLTTGLVNQAETITVRATVGALTADAAVTIANRTITSLVVSPSPNLNVVGSTTQFTAIGFDGTVQVDVSPAWSKVSGVGTINASTGLYTAGTVPGSATIRATVGAITKDVAVAISGGEVSVLVISPTNPSIGRGQDQTFTVVGRDSYGNSALFDGSQILWNNDSGVGALDSNGETSNIVLSLFDAVGTYPNSISVSYRALITRTGFTVT